MPVRVCNGVVGWLGFPSETAVIPPYVPPCNSEGDGDDREEIPFMDAESHLG
jgi:hypothetical protein